MISIQVTGIDQVRAQLGAAAKQATFAASKALNATAKDVQQAIPAGLRKSLDRPTNFTASPQALRIERADKNNLAASVLFKDKQASYMRYQVEGGTRQPTRKALRLPSAVQLNEYGNLPKGIIAQLIAVARKESKLGKRKARRIKVSNKVELFYGDPADVGGHKYPPGIYKIVQLGANRSQLVPLIVFPAVSARYEKRVDLDAIARPVVVANFNRHFNEAFSAAMASAR